ncbi:MAG: CpsD/CapB family tyrosine-protein kinase [Erysipelotrichaceae bacterium]|nr:CpsD/CapB family tyrosine-protein kinase [Erysipelotrichaceae bacterium]
MKLFGKKKHHSDGKHDKKLKIIGDEAPFNYVEAYKSLRTNIDFIASTNNYKTLLVTSAEPGDGKSTVTINLAAVLAEGGKKVVLVDCDLRKGSATSYLKVSRRTPGITNILVGSHELKDVLLHNKKYRFHFLPVGSLPQNPSEVVGSQKMLRMLEVLAEAFDYVIIDAPPVSVVTDATILGRYVDGCILVARIDYTSKQGFALAKKKLEDVNAHIIGGVLNDFDPKKHSHRGDYYSYSYQYYNAYRNEDKGGTDK